MVCKIPCQVSLYYLLHFIGERVAFIWYFQENDFTYGTQHTVSFFEIRCKLWIRMRNNASALRLDQAEPPVGLPILLGAQSPQASCNCNVFSRVYFSSESPHKTLVQWLSSVSSPNCLHLNMGFPITKSVLFSVNWINQSLHRHHVGPVCEEYLLNIYLVLPSRIAST